MKSLKTVFILLLLSGFTIRGFLYAQSDIQKLVATLPKLDGYIPVYYPEGCDQNAEKLQSLFQKAEKYYDEKFGICIPVTLILFSPEETRKLSKLINLPVLYNQFLPFVNVDNPNAICLPVDHGSALDSIIQSVSKSSQELQKLKLSSTEISDRFNALAGLHLLSRLYMNALRINQPGERNDEMMANNIADAFINEMSPTDAELWKLMKDTYDSYLNSGRNL